MGRRPLIDRTPEEKRQIVREGIKSANVSKTCRRHDISPSLLRTPDEPLGGGLTEFISRASRRFGWPCRTFLQLSCLGQICS